MKHSRENEIRPLPKAQTNGVPKRNLAAYFHEVGRSMADFLASLECPDCGSESDLDWVFERFSLGKPQLLCRHCERRFPIANLRFKSVSESVEDAGFVAELERRQTIFALPHKVMVSDGKVVDVKK